MLLDTNIVAYSTDTLNEHYAPSYAVITSALDQRVPGVLVPQVLLEFWSVVTRPRQGRQSMTPGDAWRAIELLRVGLPVLPLRNDVFDYLAQLVLVRRSSGPAIYDLFLAAQMCSHGIGQICTYSVTDFSGIAGIEALTPEQALVRYGIPPAPQR